MQPAAVAGARPTSVMLQRRTNRLIAAAIIVIGLTMMVSNIAQCIYIGMVFIVISIIWLARMRMAENKTEPPRPEINHSTSPVLFLVTANMLPGNSLPNRAIHTDKPPTYDQILSLDGLPPEYSSLHPDDLSPPQYHEVMDSDELPKTHPSDVSVTIESPPEGATAEQPTVEDTGSRSTNSLWSAFSRGIAATRSFSLPQRYSNRRRNLSSASSIGNISSKEGSSSKLVKLQVPTLQHDTQNTSPSYHLNTSFDYSDVTFNVQPTNEDSSIRSTSTSISSNDSSSKINVTDNPKVSS